MSFIAGLSDQDRHLRRSGVGRDELWRRLDRRLPVPMAGLEHIEVEHTFVGDGASRRLERMHRDGTMVWVGLPHVPRDLSPLFAACLTTNDPDHRIGAVVCDQVSPVPLIAFDPDGFQAASTSPAADDRRDDPGVYQVPKAPVGVVEVGRIELAEVARLVRHASLVLPARLEHPFVGIWTADDLYDTEPLGLTVRRKLLKAFPGQPFGKPLPPGVAQPEEGRAVLMAEVPPVCRNPDRAVLKEPVVALVPRHLDPALDTLQAQVRHI